MSRYQKLAANTALVSVGTFGSKLLVFLMVRFYTEWMHPADYGTADLLTQTANLLLPLVTLGITDGVFRYAIDRTGAQSRVFTIGFWTVTAGSALATFTCAILAGLPEIGQYGPLVVAFVAASGYHSLCAQFVRGLGKMRLFALQGLVNTALMVAFSVLFLAVWPLGIAGYVGAFTLANLLTTCGLVLHERLWRALVARPGKRLAVQMLRYSLPLVPAAVFWWIMNVSDRYLVNLFLGPAATGLYTVAGKIPTILTILAGMFLDAWQFSATSEQHAGSEEHRRFYSQVWRVFTAGMLAAGSLLILTAPFSVEILADEDYLAAWRYVPILVLAMVVAAFSNFLGSVYVVFCRTGLSFATSLVGAVLNILLNLLLIPSFLGAQGAAVATLVSCLAVFLIRAVNVRRFLPFTLHGAWLALALGLLAFQCVTMLLQFPGWSIACMLVTTLMLALSARPLLQTFAVLRRK